MYKFEFNRDNFFNRRLETVQGRIINYIEARVQPRKLSEIKEFEIYYEGLYIPPNESLDLTFEFPQIPVIDITIPILAEGTGADIIVDSWTPYAWGMKLTLRNVSGSYIYAGGGSDTRKVYKYLKSDLSKIAESIDYGGVIYALIEDDNYIYIGGTSNNVWKIQKSNMSKIAESADFGGTIFALTQDNDYIYIGGYHYVWKIQKSNMSKIAESAEFSGHMLGLAQDTNYIYAVGTASKLQKIQKSNMATVADNDNYTGDIWAITQDDDYIYIGGIVTVKVWKVQKSDLSKVAESVDLGGDIYALEQDDNYIYAGGDNKEVWKIQKSDMTKIAEISYGGSVRALIKDSSYIYAGGGTIRKVYKIQTSNMTKVAESDNYGGTIYALDSEEGGISQPVTGLTTTGKTLDTAAQSGGYSFDYTSGGDIIAVQLDASILLYGILGLDEPFSHDFIQNETIARYMLNAILGEFGAENRFVTIDTRGNIALKPGDIVRVSEYKDTVFSNYRMTRHVLSYNGALSGVVEGVKTE